MKGSNAAKTSSGARVTLLKAGLVACLAVALFLTTWMLDRASINVAWFAYGWTYGFFVNAVPVVLLFLLLLVVFNRVTLAFIVALGLSIALYAANFLKLKYLDVPVSFSDAYLLGNLHVDTIKLLSGYLGIWQIVAALVVVAGIVAASIWLERPWFRRWGISRIIICLVVVVFGVSAGTGAGWIGDVYGARNLRVVPFSPLLTQLHAGLISSVLYTSVERREALAAPVNEGAIKALLTTGPGSVPPPSGMTTGGVKPDIVVIQSESFFDPGILKDIANTDEALPDLHRALAAGIGGTMKPPTYGGGTLRTEFEVLTGIPMAAYPHVEFPYLEIVQPTIPSFVRVLRSHGYATVAIHANARNFWNRGVAFQEIGFQKFLSKDAFPRDAHKDGWYISDQAMTDKIIATLEQAKTPTLVFAVSIEAHGPYLNDPVDDPGRRDAIPAPPGLQGKSLLEYRNYLYHIENADRQMGRLWNFLKARKRPYILVFYGDHLPALTHVYPRAHFDNGLDGPDQFVPWFIVGTGVQPRSVHIYAWMMGGDILRAAGIPLTPYYQLVAKAQTILEAGVPAAKQDEILQGIYSLGRLHLRHKLGKYLAEADHGENNHLGVAHD